jgi:hypothetical protein
MEGYSDLTSQLAAGVNFLVLEVCMRGAPFWGAYVDVELVYQLS